MRRARGRPEELPRIDAAEEGLRAAVQSAPFIAALASGEVEEAQRRAANAATLDESLDATLRLYRVIENAVRLAQPILVDTLRAIEGRAA